jgi:(p)ppGpp synthase/HD superfamily hydrolase
LAALSVNLTDRFVQALMYAARVHAGQKRKGTAPYIAHLMGTAALTLEYGGDEDQAIAALLHDAPEDQGGRERLNDIREKFGEHVALIVEGCTDSWEQPKRPWRERKENYIRHLPDAHPDVLLVSCADKLYNTRAIIKDFRLHGDALWQRFNGKKDGTLWYYRTLADLFLKISSMPIAQEFGRAVEELEGLVGEE